MGATDAIRVLGIPVRLVVSLLAPCPLHHTEGATFSTICNEADQAQDIRQLDTSISRHFNQQLH